MYAIELRKPSWNPMKSFYVRVYKNQKEWVTRLHFKTATHFSTEAEAQKIIDKFDLGRHKPIITTY